VSRLLKDWAWEATLVVLIALAAVWSTTLSPYFLDPVNLLSSLSSFVIFALMAFGLFPVVVQGEIDISLASTLAVGAVLLALLSTAGVPLLVGLLVALVACALLGAVNGLLVAVAGLPSLAVTLGSLGAFRGVAYVFAGSSGVTGLTPEYTALGSTWVGIVPSPVVLAVVVGVAFAVLMAFTRFGPPASRWSATGSSPTRWPARRRDWPGWCG
jgi:rhamnose transport system permease protein